MHSAPPTQHLTTGGGRIAFDDTGGDGQLVVAVPGIGDLRAEYRHLRPLLVAAGHRVVTMDLRGHGESDTGWASYAPEDVGADLVALLAHLGAGDAAGSAAVVMGTSMAAASSVWAAAEAPSRVAGLVLAGPFVRDLPVAWWQRALLRVITAKPWASYVRGLHPTGGPEDLGVHVEAVRANMRERGRMAAVRAMLRASKSACEARIEEVRAPVLVVMGEQDHDFEDPAAEAALVAQRLGGEVAMIPEVGHYPHAERAGTTADAVLAFMAQRCRA